MTKFIFGFNILLNVKCFVEPQFEAQLEEMKAAWETGGVEGCTQLLESKRDGWKEVPLNVAVIGSSGVGKSSFINTIRGLSADDEAAAEVDVIETTMEICSYPDRENSMLLFWDLPGVGTKKFPRATYLTDIDVDRYDFFLLVTADRFTEIDTWLGQEFRDRNKNFFFVRTKIGVDVFNNMMTYRERHNEEAVIDKIRQSTECHLIADGFNDVPMFLIDNYAPQKFDFEKLKQHLIKVCPEEKRSALVLSLQSTSEDMIKLKVAELRRRIWKCAVASAAAGAIPFPIVGLAVSLSVDIGIVIGESRFYFKQLGLDSESLKRYSTLYGVDYEGMQAIVNKVLGIKAAGAVTADLMKTIVLLTLRSSVPKLAAGAAKLAKVVTGFIPVIGSVLSASASFGGTYFSLKVMLAKFEETASEVMKYVAASIATAKKTDTAKQATGSDDTESAGGVKELPS